MCYKKRELALFSQERWKRDAPTCSLRTVSSHPCCNEVACMASGGGRPKRSRREQGDVGLEAERQSSATWRGGMRRGGSGNVGVSWAREQQHHLSGRTWR